MSERWNHNLHYHSVILNAVPGGAARALDVGCGEGGLARQHDHGADIEYLLGDFLTHPFEPASFDVIGSVAALHHMDATVALHRMRDLLRAGGSLAVVGLARSEFPADLPFDLAGVVATRFHRLTKTYWKHPSPTVEISVPGRGGCGVRLSCTSGIPGW